MSATDCEISPAIDRSAKLGGVGSQRHSERIIPSKPTPPLDIVVNGKFLSAGATAVHRVAEELTRRLQQRIANDAALAERLSLELWIPPNGRDNAIDAGLKVRVVGPFKGIPWEQVTLPLRARGRVILSLCNVGPVLTRNAMTMFHDAQVRITPRSYSWPFRLWYRFHQGIAGARHRRILTVSNFSRKEIARSGIAATGRIGLIYNGVEHHSAAAADPSVLDRLRLHDRPFVVALANTQAHKNIGLLLKAFSDPQLAHVRLVLFGKATAEDFGRTGHGIPTNVVFTGLIADGELRSLYEHALCMAFPSLTEGFGLPPLEAMSLGCPAIVAPEGAVPEVCADAVIYADAHDPAPWVETIRDLLSNPAQREDLSSRGRRQAAGFTWERAADMLIAELLDLQRSEK